MESALTGLGTLTSDVRLTGIDYLIIALALGGLAVGLMQGLVRQLAGVVALLIAIVPTALYHGAAAGLIVDLFPALNPALASAYGLTLTFVVANVGLQWVGYQVFPGTRLTSFAGLDRVGGAAMGLLWGWLIAGIGLAVFSYLAGLPWGMQEQLRRDADVVLVRSELAPLVRFSLDLLILTLHPLLPGGLPFLG